jgi:hypothetical protein
MTNQPNKNLINVNISLDQPNELVEFAKTLKTVIVEQQLFVKIANKNYPLVEAWQFAGGVLRVMPVVTELVDLSDENNFKYRAVVELRRMDNDAVVGRGFAICTNAENTKKYFDEYAIASMAQTRAIGKAYRNAFGWLMKLAGYEATPSEEIIEAETVATTESKKNDIVNNHNS